MILNTDIKDVLSIAGTIFTPCFALMVWMYNNGIKGLREDIAKIFSKIDDHIQWHLDND